MVTGPMVMVESFFGSERLPVTVDEPIATVLNRNLAVPPVLPLKPQTVKLPLFPSVALICIYERLFVVSVVRRNPALVLFTLLYAKYASPFTDSVEPTSIVVETLPAWD